MSSDLGGMALPGFSQTQGYGDVKRNIIGEFEQYETEMTLLDYFADQIATGHAAIPDERRCPADRHTDVDVWRKELIANDARYCYDLAGAMIAEKRKRESA